MLNMCQNSKQLEGFAQRTKMLHITCRTHALKGTLCIRMRNKEPSDIIPDKFGNVLQGHMTICKLLRLLKKAIVLFDIYWYLTFNELTAFRLPNNKAFEQ